MRKDLIPYFGLPFYRAMIERTGLRRGHRGATTAPPATSRRCRTRSPTPSSKSSPRWETPQALVGGIERYRAAGASSPCVGPIPGTDFEATLRVGLGS